MARYINWLDSRIHTPKVRGSSPLLATIWKEQPVRNRDCLLSRSFGEIRIGVGIQPFRKKKTLTILFNITQRFESAKNRHIFDFLVKWYNEYFKCHLWFYGVGVILPHCHCGDTGSSPVRTARVLLLVIKEMQVRVLYYG